MVDAFSKGVPFIILLVTFITLSRIKTGGISEILNKINNQVSSPSAWRARHNIDGAFCSGKFTPAWG